MKKTLCCLLALLLLTALVGCGVKDKIQEKAAEKAAEQFIEGMGGGSVDIDGDKVTIKDEAGGELTLGGTEWPDSDLAKSIPEFTKGQITTVMEGGDGLVVAIDSVEKADYDSYLTAIKKDFATDAYEMNTEDYSSYGAANADGVSVFLQYGSNSLSISVSKAAE